MSYTFETLLAEAETLLRGDAKAGTNRFKELQQQWKTLGRSSQAQHQRFREIGDALFERRRVAREDAQLEFETRQQERAARHAEFVARTKERIAKLEDAMKRTEEGIHRSEDRLKELEVRLSRAAERLRDTYGLFGKKPLRGNSDHKQREEYVTGLEQRVDEIRVSIHERQDRLKSMQDQHRTLREKLADAERNQARR